MNRTLKSFAKDFLPPMLVRIFKPGTAYGWKGNFTNWSEVLQQCSGYSAENILQKVKEATLKVKNGEAVYERDSVNFETIEYSWPLLSSLMWVAAKNKGNLRVIDYGGSLGSSYFQNRKFLATLDVQWSVVEQPSFVKCGQQFIQDDSLKFFNSITEAINRTGTPHLLMISVTLPYLEKPYDLLEEVLQYRIPHVVIDSTPFNWESSDRLTIQKVNPAIYEASYPCWFLNYDKVKSKLSEKYSIHTEYKNEPAISLDGHPIQYQGLLAILK